MLCGPIYIYECYKYITVRKDSSRNEFSYDFQLTSVKKKETHGIKHVVEENQLRVLSIFAMDFIKLIRYAEIQ